MLSGSEPSAPCPRGPGPHRDQRCEWLVRSCGEGRVVANLVEVLVVCRVLERFPIELGCAFQMCDRSLAVAGLRLEAGRVVVPLPLPWVLCDRVLDLLAPGCLVSGSEETEGNEDLLPLGDLVRDAGLGAEGDDGRFRLDCVRLARRPRRAVDEHPRRSVDLPSVEVETRMAEGHEVELFVA